MTEPKLGAYICKGCGISERLNCDQLAQVASSEGKAAVVRQHPFLCSAAGVEMIRSDMAGQGINQVVIAACSRRAKTEAFAFDTVTTSRANLREGVIWIRPDHEDNQETTQEMAADYVRMACAEVQQMRQPGGNTETGVNKQILVVGGGISGLTAALESAAAGYHVLLVEKSAALGGWASKLYRSIPTREPYADPQDTGVELLIHRVQTDPQITVYLNSYCNRTSGAPGQFSIDISTESGATHTVNAGAIIQASGFTRYDASQLPELGYGQSPDIIDQAELERLASAAGTEGSIVRPSDQAEVKAVVFVQCAGQRSNQPGHLPYCSGFCCNAAIKQAMYFKDNNPSVDTVILYTDLRTPGNGEDFYRSAQRKGITFSKGKVTSVVPGKQGAEVFFDDLILDTQTSIQADLVVLATGQIANAGIDVEHVTSAEEPTDKTAISVLNLSYRQGPDVPQLKHGFADSHFICFPYETRRTGIYACGPVRRPMDMAQARIDATGAALKAIQAVENAVLGRAAHPRSGDLSFPSFRKEGCTQCKRCTVECPFGAIDEDENRYPLFNESRCRRCGTCMGACPVRVISFQNYSVDTVGQQIKHVEIPDEMDEKPRILILACENDAYPALDMAAHNRLSYSAWVRVIPVRCLGSVNTIWITDALNSGYDGIMLLGCKKGDNYQCHFVKGSEVAHDRMSKISDTLEQLQLEKERVAIHEVEITDIQRLPALINDYADVIEKIGMNPFKGF
ncbi:MAG TPA: FAD-dependent oxidoreductase [Gammaproteobacteria bacterium]|mgnify:CR=1 FL=1|nr:FAD-dependent oxidoreductase [Gammaproteobacteria bacterium]